MIPPPVPVAVLDSVTLEPSSPVPLYHQLAARLQELVSDRPDLNGKRLPAEVDLARRLHISRSTVRQALTQLAAQGLVRRRAAVGTTFTM